MGVVVGAVVVVSGQSYSSFPFAQSAFPSQVHLIGMQVVALHANSPGQLLSEIQYSVNSTGVSGWNNVHYARFDQTK